MLQSIDTPKTPPQAIWLVEQALAALDADLGSARQMLDRLAVVLSSAAPREEPSFLPGSRVRSSGPARGGLAGWQIRAVAAHVEAHIGASVSVGALAARVGLSASYFCRAFKVSTDETPHAYIMRRRLEHAQAMMLETDESLAHIAAVCGLADQAHLTRLFRRYVGQTPNVWRRENRPWGRALITGSLRRA
ncbi:helix-turn-helix domain-containing protein [Caulobacter endophyticus]|uniref:helix-turn-helix domain-containing protein n=1 Tax=Caulobacter endophyticus TaxID=2172652 RepID=UPI0024106C5D|nr:AraC family transcriptional regulator [Caulobacter endophyticus]MDG2530698.1 AraC family transcriptional regulator [Caulobacter endophyticus]